LKRTSVILLIVAVTLVTGSSAFALRVQDLTLDSVVYSLDVNENVYYTGGIQQYDPATDPWTRVTNNYVGYSLPKLTVWDRLHTNKLVDGVWAVCIDTREWATNPEAAYLKQGWAQTTPGGDDPHIPLSRAGRLNGTVLDADAWNHTTYLFGQYAQKIGSMSDVQKAAFQLATWEVMSGDGSATGGTWDSGLFTATNVAGTDPGSIRYEADQFVRAAYIGYGSWWEPNAKQALYFTGAVVNGEYKQDFLVWAPPSVPEIPAVLLGPLGLAALAMLRRRLVK